MSVLPAFNSASLSVRSESGRSEPRPQDKAERSAFARLLDASDQPIGKAAAKAGAEQSAMEPETARQEPSRSVATLARAADQTPRDKAETTYSAEVQIGEDAVGFAARPIVGPSSLRYESTHSGTASAKASPSHGFIKVDWKWVDIPLKNSLEGERYSPISTVMINSLRSSSHSLSAYSMALHPNEVPRLSTRELPATVSVQVHPGPRPQHISGKSAGDHLANQAVPQPRASFRASTAPLVQLLADHAEYRLLIRTQKLNAHERAYIASEITSALKQFGMAALPVRTIHPSERL